jgi:RNA polymerase sigma factor (sigma-70 family)
MTKQRAWSHYFTTGDREPLIRAYWKSINVIAWDLFPRQQEDMVQVGMIGLLRALDKLDVDRVKSLDAWIYLNARGEMLKARRFKPTWNIDFIEPQVDPTDIDEQVDLTIALEQGSLDSARDYLEGYQPRLLSLRLKLRAIRAGISQ